MSFFSEFEGTRLYLRRARDELPPGLPLRAAVPVLEGGLRGLPAAVLVVEPEARQAQPLLHVGEPVGGDVDAPGQSA